MPTKPADFFPVLFSVHCAGRLRLHPNLFECLVGWDFVAVAIFSQHLLIIHFIFHGVFFALHYPNQAIIMIPRIRPLLNRPSVEDFHTDHRGLMIVVLM